jgi:hypothetical protein
MRGRRCIFVCRGRAAVMVVDVLPKWLWTKMDVDEVDEADENYF